MPFPTVPETHSPLPPSPSPAHAKGGESPSSHPDPAPFPPLRLFVHHEAGVAVLGGRTVLHQTALLEYIRLLLGHLRVDFFEFALLVRVARALRLQHQIPSVLPATLHVDLVLDGADARARAERGARKPLEHLAGRIAEVLGSVDNRSFDGNIGRGQPRSRLIQERILHGSVMNFCDGMQTTMIFGKDNCAT